MQIISSLRLLLMYFTLWRYFNKHKQLFLELLQLLARFKENKRIYRRLAKKKSGHKKANKTQHKSKLVKLNSNEQTFSTKLKFSAFFSSFSVCCCCYIDGTSWTDRIFALFSLTFCTFSYMFVDDSIILLFASYMNSNEFFLQSRLLVRLLQPVIKQLCRTMYTWIHQNGNVYVLQCSKNEKVYRRKSIFIQINSN